MELNKISDYIGEKVSGVTQKTLEFMVERGIFTSPTTSKIITILIVLVLSYLTIHFAKGLQKPIKWGIIITAIVLILSVLFSFG